MSLSQINGKKWKYMEYQKSQETYIYGMEQE